MAEVNSMSKVLFMNDDLKIDGFKELSLLTKARDEL